MDNADKEKSQQPQQPPNVIYLNETEIARQIHTLLAASGIKAAPEMVRLVVAYHTNHLENVGLIKFITKP